MTRLSRVEQYRIPITVLVPHHQSPHNHTNYMNNYVPLSWSGL